MVNRNSSGSLAIPCLLMALVLSTAGFGIWGILRQWRQKTEAQLALDQCVGKTAIELKEQLERLDASDKRMRGAARIRTYRRCRSCGS